MYVDVLEPGLGSCGARAFAIDFGRRRRYAPGVERVEVVEIVGEAAR
jgi:hypothetical protein